MLENRTMPVIHTATFRVRHYECDSNGHLNSSNYLRYMEEAAFEASASVGYDKARYESIGFAWLARETEIEYLQPVFYGESVEIRTWVGDFRRVRSRRHYEFRLAGSDELLASASTDWVYLKADTLLPAAVPPEMIAAFAPDGDVKMAPRRERFPEPPPPPPGVFKLRRRSEWRDIDTPRHVNNAAYVDYINNLGIQAALAHGWTPERMRELGFAIIARKHHIEYRQPALLDDELELTTWVSDVRRASSVRHYTISRVADGELLTRIRSLWFCVGLADHKPMRFPSAFDDFARISWRVEMVTAEAIFSTAITVGLMLLFTLFVEWLVGTYILKRLPVGRIMNMLAGLLAVSLLVFGLVRQGTPSDPQSLTFEQAGDVVGLLASVAVVGGFVLSFGVSFISKRIGPGMLALALVAFFGSGVVLTC
jgi:acyl-CoA thioester hydrolase